MEKKFKLGQFYTTRANYIIGNLVSDIPKDKIVVEPFCGNGDLLIVDNEFELYDIDPKIDGCIKRDTLLDPPSYSGKIVITNPPFLARNKNSDKRIYDFYNVNDLYKASIKSILDCDGGILIVPLNFFCDEDDSVRDMFFENFEVEKLNIFEETVFDDTAYTICSFLFTKISSKKITDQNVKCKFFPSGEEIEFNLKKRAGYKIGSDFFELIEKYPLEKRKVTRLKTGETPNSNLFLRAIDTGSKNGRVSLKVQDNYFFGEKNDRAFATIVFDNYIQQKNIEKIYD